jgi:hypothetical protein
MLFFPYSTSNINVGSEAGGGKVCGNRRNTHSILFSSALSWLSRFLYTVSASVESSTSKGILGRSDDDDEDDDGAS